MPLGTPQTDPAAPNTTSGSGAPTTTPTAIGDVFVDTLNDVYYVATGTASSADWIAASGISEVSQDLTPQLGGALDVNGQEITGAIDLHSTGDIIAELGDAAGTNKVSILDAGAVEVAAIDSDGNITTSGTVDGRDIATDGTKLDGIASGATAVSNLSNLSDVTSAGVTARFALVADGAAYVGRALTEADISDLQAYITGITGEAIGSLSDVTITSIGTGELLTWNGSAFINETLAEAGIAADTHTHTASDVTDFDSAADARIALATLETLSDVTETTITTGDVLRWNGSAWVNYADSNYAAASHTHASTDISDSTIDGRALLTSADANAFTDADETKLDGIEAGATADQTGAEIKTLYEAEANTNAYTDAEQTKVGHISVTQAVDLDQMETDIAALANGMVYQGVWDASAGTFPGGGTAQTGAFYYVSVAGTVGGVAFDIGDNIVATTDNASTATYAANWSKHDQTDAVQSVAGKTGAVTLVAADISDATADGQALLTSADANPFTDADESKLDGIEALADVTDQTNVTAAVGATDAAAVTDTGTAGNAGALVKLDVSGNLDGRDVAADGTKLDGIESGATADQTAADIRTLGFFDITNDGAASGLDADLLDGNHASAFALSSHTHITADITDITAAGAALIDDADAAAQRTTLGLGTTDNPQFATIELGAASDTTLSRSAAGVLAVEGVDVVTTAGTGQQEVIGIACSDETTDLTTGTAKVTFRMPFAMTLSDVRANVNTAPTGSTLTVDINEAGVSILSTLLTIDATEETSETAATPAVISDTALADDAEMTIDIDAVGSTTAGKGLKVWLIGTRA